LKIYPSFLNIIVIQIVDTELSFVPSLAVMW